MNASESFHEAVEKLSDALKLAKELDQFNDFLITKYAEVTHMQPWEIRESWKIYREAQATKHQEATPCQ